MFEICNKINNVCSFCAKSDYHPEKQQYDKKQKLFCGIAGGYNTLVSNLPDCWLAMSKSQRSTFLKKQKQKYLEMKLRRRG
tara:strand:- start:2723 stop:2965 length:243 start_codon:yes stop_codon:yes gene_type:complete